MAESEWYPTESGRQHMETGGGDVGERVGNVIGISSSHFPSHYAFDLTLEIEFYLVLIFSRGHS